MIRSGWRWTRALWLGTTTVLAVAAGAACGAEKEKPPGSETNWLLTCSSDADCGQSSCLCGVCTISCDDDAPCTARAWGRCAVPGSAPHVAQCATSPSPSEASGLCLPECSDTAPCSTGSCVEGRCVEAGGGSTASDFTAAFCAAARSCCERDGFGTAALSDCEAEFERQIDAFALLAKGTLLVDEAQMAECVSAVQGVATSCTWQGVQEACEHAFQGTLSEGGVCEDAEECIDDAGPALCLLIDGQPGECVAPQRGAEGTPCARSCPAGDSCSLTSSTPVADPPRAYCYEEDGLYCASGLCAALAAEGGGCDGDDACASTHYCADVCQPRAPLGAGCSAPSSCLKGLACSNGTCIEAPFASASQCAGDFN